MAEAHVERNTEHTPYVAHVRDVPFAELDNMATALEGLMGHPGWAVLMQILEAQKHTVDARLFNGGRALEARADYAILHGRREGLDAARVACEAVIAKRRERQGKLERELDNAGAGSSAGRR